MSNGGHVGRVHFVQELVPKQPLRRHPGVRRHRPPKGDGCCTCTSRNKDGSIPWFWYGTLVVRVHRRPLRRQQPRRCTFRCHRRVPLLGHGRQDILKQASHTAQMNRPSVMRSLIKQKIVMGS